MGNKVVALNPKYQTGVDFYQKRPWRQLYLGAPEGAKRYYEISFYELNKLYDAFADELSKNGYGCMLYGSKNYLEQVWDKTDVRPVWLAHYTEKTDYKGPYMLWQASCTGKISGISGDVDMDILYNKN